MPGQVGSCPVLLGPARSCLVTKFGDRNLLGQAMVTTFAVIKKITRFGLKNIALNSSIA